MRKNLTALFVASLPFLFHQSCQREENLAPVNGQVSFSPVMKSRGDSDNASVPASLQVTIQNSQGVVVRENAVLTLSPNGTSEGLQLPAGDYTITSFFATDADNKLLAASPVKGSMLAEAVAEPLPLKFSVGKESVTIPADVLGVQASDASSDFGYVRFPCDLSPNLEAVPVNVAVKIVVGEILYENLDATVRIKGFGSDNSLRWMKEFAFAGPVDQLNVATGFHHYSIELVNKWGVNDVQDNIPASDITNGRADGSAPITFVMGGTRAARKLLQVITSREADPGKSTAMVLESRRSYTYGNDGMIKSILYEQYDTNTAQFFTTGTDEFTTDGKKVLKITTVRNGALYSEYDYEYGSDSRITQTLFFDNNRTWVQTTSPDFSNSVFSVNYNLSGGQSFDYQYRVSYKNITHDKTTRSGELCSQGLYTYDKNINPLRHLGYIDFNFLNGSINNKLIEDVSYIGCAFPTVTPVQHAYTYTDDGYPLKETITYKSGLPNANPDFTYHTETEYRYQ